VTDVTLVERHSGAAACTLGRGTKAASICGGMADAPWGQQSPPALHWMVLLSLSEQALAVWLAFSQLTSRWDMSLPCIAPAGMAAWAVMSFCVMDMAITDVVAPPSSRPTTAMAASKRPLPEVPL